MKFTKDAQVSARLHPSTKEKLAKSGYNAAEAIEWFVHEFFSNNPKRKMKIKKDMLEINLDNLKKMQCEIQVEIEAIERQLESFVGEDLDFEVSPIKIEVEPEVELPNNLQEAIDKIQAGFDKKRDMLVSPKTDLKESIDSFIVLNGDFVRGIYSEHCKGLKWSEFHELLLEELT